MQRLMLGLYGTVRINKKLKLFNPKKELIAMKGVMKFEVGDKVRSKREDKSGEIINCRHEKFKLGTGEIKETIKYSVKTAIYHSSWYEQEDLEYVDTFDNDFESGLLDLLIDVNLKENKLDNVKDLHNRKQNYKKG